MSSAVPFFNNEFSEEIWNDNYRFKDETIEDTFRRLVNTIFINESLDLKSQLYDALINKRISFGGRVVANVGTGIEGVSNFNCYSAQRASKPYDSINGIYQDLLNAAEILKTEGGIGYNFNHLRPRGTIIRGIRSASPGVVEFMTLYDKSSEIITKSNPGEIYQSEDMFVKRKIRKGAQISILEVWHPDIIEYIEAKRIPNKLTKFNMSVGVTNEFMKAVLNNDSWDLVFPDIHHSDYNKEWNGRIEEWKEKYPDAIVVYKSMHARELWDLIIKNTYERNEPGLFFVDNANRYNNILHTGQKIVSTNPCGEISMISDTYEYTDKDGTVKESAGDICNLGHLNLVSYFNPNLDDDFDYDLMVADVKILNRALDNLIDISAYPLEGIKNAAEARRRVGAGILGYGSLLLMKKMRYGSEEANEFTKRFSEIYAVEAYRSSMELAKEKGPFILCDPKKIVKDGFIANSGIIPKDLKDDIEKYGLRNVAMLTCAPTGNTGVFMNIVSGGVEPLFALSYNRWAIVGHKADLELKGKSYPSFFKGEWNETKDFKFELRGDEQVLMSTCGNYMIDKNRGLTKKVLCEDFGWKWLKENCSESEIAELSERGILATSMELSVKEHMDPFIILSKNIDNSLSKTINIANDYPIEDFSEIFIELWKNGGRGVTTYRDGSMTAVLETAKTEQALQQEREEFYDEWKSHHIDDIVEDIKPPTEFPMMGYKVKSEGKKWYINVSFKDRHMKRPFAIFIKTNAKEGSIVTTNTVEFLEKLARKTKIKKKFIEENAEKSSHQTNVDKIVRTIGLLLRHNVKVQDIVETLDKVEVPVSSFVFVIKKFLMKYVENGLVYGDGNQKCPECSGKIIYQEGCIQCGGAEESGGCGWSKC